MSVSTLSIEKLSIDTIRTLSMDAVQAANSGHPGTPMALAPVLYTLWHDALTFDPQAPRWPGRDRFVLSCGHASMLLYSVLHLAQVQQVNARGEPTGELAVPLEHIRKFRQLHSRCPGHPESLETSGVETTTGPLGQGLGNSVGMAIAQKWLAAKFNKPGFSLFDYRIYAFCSDGDLMEGISSEAASMAGHLRLNNLCWIYDDNRITIEGSTDLAFSEDVAQRFAAQGWQVERVADANDIAALRKHLRMFQSGTDRPVLIIVRSQIAFGAPNKQGTPESHGAPLGEDEIRLAKKNYGWPEEAKFHVPEEVLEHFRDGPARRGAAQCEAWHESWEEYRQVHPQLAAQWEQMNAGQLPAGWDKDLAPFAADTKGLATRASSGKVINQIGKNLPWLLGGSADLAESTKTLLTFDGAFDFCANEYAGHNFHFGIREHGMSAVINGMALSKLRPYGATFLVFSDYCRGSIRLSALMQLPVLYVFTHDSIGVGEDGPTHQPVEHLAALRAIPGLLVMRPGDANEVTEAYRTAISTGRPTAMVLTRQNLPTYDRTKTESAQGVSKGGYVLIDAPQSKPQVLLLASGSEVCLCMAAYEKLQSEGIAARVVSMPCWELFEEQPQAYKDQVLPPAVRARVGVEAAIELGWSRYLTDQGIFVGMKSFGASAPGGVLAKEFGLTPENVVAAAKKAMGK